MSIVTRINLDSTRKRATGVTYIDGEGNEWEQQPTSCCCARSVVQCAASAGVRHPVPYRPEVRQWHDWPQLLLPGYLRRCVLRQELQLQSIRRVGRHRHVHRAEFNGDNFDHGNLGFVGGGYIGAVQTNGRPIPQGERARRRNFSSWGAAWKKAVADNPLQLRDCDARKLLQLSRLLPGPRPDLHRCVWQQAAAHHVLRATE